MYDLNFLFFQTYYESPEVKLHQNRNSFKLPVSEDVLKIVRNNFSREIEFYEFCKQRLQKQFEEIWSLQAEETSLKMSQINFIIYFFVGVLKKNLI
jgi:hypothetical protein